MTFPRLHLAYLMFLDLTGAQPLYPRSTELFLHFADYGGTAIHVHRFLKCCEIVAYRWAISHVFYSYPSLLLTVRRSETNICLLLPKFILYEPNVCELGVVPKPVYLQHRSARRGSCVVDAVSAHIAMATQTQPINQSA